MTFLAPYAGGSGACDDDDDACYWIKYSNESELTATQRQVYT